MKTSKLVLALIASLALGVLAPETVEAKGSSGSGHHSSGSHASGTSHSKSSASPGTGSSHGSVNVKGYTKKNGTYVAPHKRSAPDKTFNNNWSAKGNVNPYTGKAGTQTQPPTKSR